MRELVAGVDPPAVLVPHMHAAVVVAVHRLDIGRGIGPALQVVEADGVGGDPVGGVDQLFAAEVFMVVGGDVGVELALRLGEELRLIGGSSGGAAVFAVGWRLR